MSRHHLFDPDGLAPARGFSYGALPAEGRVLHLAGITGHHEDGTIEEGIVEQFATACRSVARVISEAGGQPSDVVAVTIYTSDMQAYRQNLGPIGSSYRAVFGKHYPPMALVGVGELMDPAALVELVCVAVVP